MHEVNFSEAIEKILARDSRFQPQAYLFVREALDYTQQKVCKTNEDQVRHVTGQELLAGIREHALQEFGPMARLLLEEWGVRSCEHFGDIVFNMVEAGLLAKTDRDSRQDFQSGYDFEEAFRQPFLPTGKSQAGTDAKREPGLKG